MADTFSHHESCSSCGSRDNFARYKSGSGYCFGCGYYENGKVSPYVLEQQQSNKTVLKLPDGCNTEYSTEVLLWISQYGLSTGELIKHKVVFNRSWNQLIFTFYGEDKELLLYQARNFNKERANSRKYFTQGDVHSVLPIYEAPFWPNSRTLVLVEDCVSAIKLSRYADAMPCLSSSISKEKLAKLRYLYDNLIIWLDGNMYDNAVKLSNQAKLLGFGTSVVYTKEDPKEVCKSEIEEIVKSCMELTE